MQVIMERGAEEIVSRLLEARYDAYVVGGCVRDALLGREANDWDICTSALPQETIALFGEGNCIPTGLKHGTVTVKMRGGLYEVTTFRTEGTYSDGRHPDSVDFVADVREDLARRDFTINAMAYNDREGLVDPFGGREDLFEHHILRAVGVPAQRFDEDALRIMRLFRFASRFGFAIEEETLRAAVALCGKLSCVSGERIREELMKLLETTAPGAYLPYEVGCVILQGMGGAGRERYEQTLRTLDALAPEAELRLAALLLPLCAFKNLSGAQAVMKSLRCSNKTVQRVTAALSLVRKTYPKEKNALRILAKKTLGAYGMDAIEDALELARVLGDEADARSIARAAAHAREALGTDLCVSMKQLAISGTDVMALPGIRPGPQVGALLARLLDAVIAEEIPNERDVLLEAAEKWVGD